MSEYERRPLLERWKDSLQNEPKQFWLMVGLVVTGSVVLGFASYLTLTFDTADVLLARLP